MDRLKLVALDAEDLAILSSHLQDAVLRVGDITYLPKEQRFVAALNRFAWETLAEERPDRFERRRAAIHFARVRSVKASRIRQDRPDAVLSLLAIEFVPTEEPEGTVTLHFAGGGAIRLEVECIEAQCADTGTSWVARAKPSHDETRSDESDAT